MNDTPRYSPETWRRAAEHFQAIADRRHETMPRYWMRRFDAVGFGICALALVLMILLLIVQVAR